MNVTNWNILLSLLFLCMHDTNFIILLVMDLISVENKLRVAE